MNKKNEEHVDGQGKVTADIPKRDDIMQSLLPELDAVQKKLDQLNCRLDEQHDSDKKQLYDMGCLRLSAAIESMTEGIVMVSEAGMIEMANPTAKKLLGLAAESSSSDVKRALETLGLKHLFTLRGQPGAKNEKEFIGKASSGKILRVKWNAIADGNRRFVGNIAVIRDVTAQIELDRSQTEFIAAISHELRTPLTTMQNSVSNMLAGVTGKTTPKMEQYLNTMQGDCQRLARLINDLLDMAKLEAGRMPINRSVTNFAEIAGKAVNDFSATAAEKGVSLELKTDGSIPHVYVDSQRIYQVFTNLITNAIKYTDKDGTISISLSERKEDVMAVVEDTGIGIATEHHRHIFNKFYQISRQAGPGYNGSGLGLALSNEIVAAHDGKMWVESEPGKGSKFYFSLLKTQPQIILHKHLSALTERANKKGEQFAMMVMRLEASNDYVRQNEELFDAVMKQIVCEGNKLMACSSDMVIRRNEVEAAIIVSQTGKRYLMHIKRMLHTIVYDAMMSSRCDCHSVVPMMGIAVYPNDASTVEAIEKKATIELNKLL